jgi:SAM-dependent methyltransferase
MVTLRDNIRRVIAHYGFDTRVRNLAVAQMVQRVLRGHPAGSTPLLADVGCGSVGVAPYLPALRVVGVDREQPPELNATVHFVRADVIELPFHDEAFPVGTCVDVLEHLPIDLRDAAIRELIRIAKWAVVIATPFGAAARECDEQYRQQCMRLGRPIPSWLSEHLRQPHPEEEALRARVEVAAAASGREVEIAVAYCEPLALTRVVRRAERYKPLWAGVSLMLGLVAPLLPAPSIDDSYRVVLVARLSQRKTKEGRARGAGRS